MRVRRSFPAIFTNSASESAFIFCITRPRFAFTGNLADAEVGAHLLVQESADH